MSEIRCRNQTQFPFDDLVPIPVIGQRDVVFIRHQRVRHDSIIPRPPHLVKRARGMHAAAIESARLSERRTNMKTNKLLVIIAALSLAMMTACPPKNESGTATSGTTAGGGAEILVGEYGSMTGPQATFGQSTHNGIMMAIDEINAKGGVDGRKIKMITEDDQSKQEEAANAVTKLISQNNVIAVLGEVASSCSLAAAPICQQNKVPMITPSSTNPEITKKGDYIFRTCFTDDYQGHSLADY